MNPRLAVSQNLAGIALGSGLTPEEAACTLIAGSIMIMNVHAVSEERQRQIFAVAMAEFKKAKERNSNGT